MRSAAMSDKFRIRFIHAFFFAFCLLCLLPFLLVVSGSLSNESDVLKHGFKLIPERFDLYAYKYLLSNPSRIIDAYKVTIFITVVGMVLGVFIMSLVAYPLSRSNFKARRIIMFFFFFTTLFHGGLVPWYLLVTRYLKLQNTLWVMILPFLVSVFYIILLRTFFQQLPVSIMESAKIDGASEIIIFMRIILPMSKPVMATVLLFTALDRWNEWYSAMLFITKENLIPLQFMLQNILQRAEIMRNNNIATEYMSTMQFPGETAKMAVVILTTGPMLFVFPFFQKYFVKGMMVGSLKN